MPDINEFEINNFISKSKEEKKSYIIEDAEKIIVPSSVDSKLKNAYKYKEVINKFILEYINAKKDRLSNFNSDQYDDLLKNEIQLFKSNYIENILPKKIKEKPTNLYEISGAYKIAKTNLVFRSLSTTMGHLWERLATISNIAINPEEDFGIKINGIDIIFLKDDKPFYCQIKTLEGTLTGSQVSRSNIELSLHEHSYFVSAFKTGTKWTFNSSSVEKLLGEEFWKLIDLNYNIILEELKKILPEIEKKLFILLAEETD